MPNIENRLRRVEASPIGAPPEEVIVRYTIISPPPRDEAGNIIGPAPEPYIWDPTKLLELRHDEAV